VTVPQEQSAEPQPSDARSDRTGGVREVVAVTLLAVTAVLTAWSGFESSKWGGEMSISFSRASSQRIEAAREAGVANSARGIDLQTFSLWLQAASQNDAALQEFVQDRFTDQFDVAFDAWTAQKPLQNPDAAKSPFALPEYVPPGQVESEQADKRADAFFADALRNNQRGDNYTLLTVLFALVLFFSAVANRHRSARLNWVLLIGATLLLVAGVALLLSFPKII
jgi:hypothetical protein